MLDISQIASSPPFHPKLQLKLDSESSNKWQDVMGLDDHLKISIMAGLIEKFSGANNYLTLNKPDFTRVTRTLACRVTSKKVSLDLNEWYEKFIDFCASNGEIANSQIEATHAVVEIIYGVEAYLVVSQDVDKLDEDSREEAEDFMSTLITKLESALEIMEELAEFKEQFDKEDNKRLSKIKCCLYADQTKAVRECGFFDAYKHCLNIIKEIIVEEDITNVTVPIAFVLCPLENTEITNYETKKDVSQFRDVDAEVVAKCCRIWTDLEQVISKAKALKNSANRCNRTPFNVFETVMLEYKEMLKTELKKCVTIARSSLHSNDEGIRKVIEIAENHSLFKLSRLDQWLDFKKSELEITGKLEKFHDVTFLAKNTQLSTKLAESFDKKYTLALFVPPLDEATNGLLVKMKDYVDTYSKLSNVNEEDDDEEDEDKYPWHMNQHKRMQVLTKVQEFSKYVAKNHQCHDQCQFFVALGESGFNYDYSVFENGTLLKNKIRQLPIPPSELEVHQSTGYNKAFNYFLVQWDHEELGYPCKYLIEYRPKEDSDTLWKQKQTTKPAQKELTICFKKGSVLEFRVAVDSCIGQSDFSEIIDTESILDEDQSQFLNCELKSNVAVSSVALQHLNQPVTRQSINGASKTESVTQDQKDTLLPTPIDLEIEWISQSMADLAWTQPSKKAGKVSYRVQYWPKEDVSSTFEIDVDSIQTECRLEQLKPETSYSVNVVTVSQDGQITSQPSQVVDFKTLNEGVRFAETIVKRCKNIGKRNGMDIYQVPLTKSTGSRTTAQRFTFGKDDSKKVGQRNGRMQHRTILVMGATGAGKTTLINGMINYIFNVEWEDTFRFQLIQENTAGRSQVDSQTSQITAYDIYHMEGYRVSYSLTIVDTPGYGDTKGLDRDQEITEQVQKFFEDKEGIQELDVVGFVAQASLPRLTPTQIYIFDSVLSIFGNDVKENINFLLTFADGQIPPVLSAVTAADLPCPMDEDTGYPLHHKFNNSGFFCSSRESNGGSTTDKFNRFFWRMGMENFQRFFTSLASMKTKSLSLTKQVLEERKTLEATVDGLQPLIKIGLTKMEEMRKTKQMITNSKAQIDANENVEFDVEVTMPKKVDNPVGQYLTNCNKCYVTCHNPCAIRNDEGKAKCSAMDSTMPRATRGCRVCPKKCIWNMHANQPYRWEYVKEKQATSSDEIKHKYEKELKRKLTAEELVKELEKDVELNDKEVLNRVEIVSKCIERLDQIALRPNPFSTPQYIDLIIDAEQQEKRPGFKERIESLKKLRHMAVITSKIRNKESLVIRDRKDDLDNQTDEDEDEDNDEDDGDPQASGKGDTDDDDANKDRSKFQFALRNIQKMFL